MGAIRDNWRIVMLVVFLLASTIALFAPVGLGGSTTTTESQTLSGDQSTLELHQTSIVIENTSAVDFQVENTSTDTITASDATIEVSIDSDVEDVTDTSAAVANSTLSVTEGTIVTPRNTTEITAGNESIAVGNATLAASDSEISLTVQRDDVSGLTNLQYGLDLSGGTRIRAPLVGSHVTDVSVDVDNVELQRQLSEQLDTDPINVNTLNTQSGKTVEIYQSISDEEFANALQASGADVSASDVKQGVTKQTRETVRKTLSQKIDRTGLSGGTVSTVSADPPLMVVEVPGQTPQQVRNVVNDRGVVQIVAEVKDPQTGEKTNTTVLTGDDIASVSPVQERRNTEGTWEAPVTVSGDESGGAALRFQQDLNELGFTTGGGVGNCDRGTETGGPQGSYCLLTVLDGEIVRSNAMGDDLARSMANGEWAKTPSFTIGAPNVSVAQDVKISLEVGSLPTKLDLSDDAEYDISYLQPSLAQRFKGLALLTGLVAWLAVSGMVFLRYKSAAVAVPMLLTAIAEVYILLGFAVVSGLALDLSHIAGLIAVIGTGVDDLIIIADEILQQGEVATGRVFQSRFRKAFWVIGAAAATTIIAMSPLAILSVGDLFGFAVVTIVGVLIGVIITRPAYGDILRHLVLSEDQR